MAPKSFSAPKAWKRPATRIYTDNYRFGNSLYSGAVADLDRRSDRPSLLRTNSPPPLSVDPGVRRAVLEADLGIAGYSNSELHRSLSANRLNELGLTASYKPIPAETSSVLHTTNVSSTLASDTFSTYSSQKALANVEAELEESRERRRRQRALNSRPQSAYFSDYSMPVETTTTSPFWMERWYTKSVRSVRHGVFPL